MKEQIIKEFIDSLTMSELDEVLDRGTDADNQYRKVESIKTAAISDRATFLKLDKEINALVNIIASEMFNRGIEFGANLKDKIIGPLK